MPKEGGTVKVFLRNLVFFTSPISIVLGMTLIGLYSAGGEVGNAMLSSLLVIYGYFGGWFLGRWSVEEEGEKKE